MNQLKFALRKILAHRWFSAAVIVTIGLGIGVNTTVFTLVNAALFKPVPVPGGERLVTVMGQNPRKPESRTGVDYPAFLEFQQRNRSFENLEAAGGGEEGEGVISENGNPPERIKLNPVTTGLFTMLHTPPILGRGFTADDGKPGAPTVALIGYDLWQSRYARAADVIGRPVQIDGSPATIIGVMPDGFKFPKNQSLWIPLVPTDPLRERSNHSLVLFGILKRGVSLTAARNDLEVMGSGLAAEFPDAYQDFGPLVRTFHDTYNGGPIRFIFLMMLGAVVCVLLIACANVANMLLGRAITRSREMSIRAALGATRWQIVRQLLSESVALSVLGGLLGLGLSLFGIHAFDLATRDVGKPYWVMFSMDYVAYAYFAAISILSGIVFGLAPALRASKVDLNHTLKEGAPAAGGQHGGRLTGALVVLQVALTMVLLAGAGLMMRSFIAAQAVNDFIPAKQIFTARVSPPEGKGERYADPETRRQFIQELLPRLAALPGAEQVAAASALPGLGAANRPIEIEGQPVEKRDDAPQCQMIVQTPGYLPMIGLPILTGRGFGESDGSPGHEATVVTRQFAARYWANEPPIGKRFRFLEGQEPGPWMTVIGVCADIDQSPRDAKAPPLIYISHRQEPWGWMALMIRTRADPSSLSSAVRSTVQEIDGDLPLFEIRTMELAQQRGFWFLEVFGTIFLIFAVVGLIMASVGIYGVVAQATAGRTREIGIRMALGATAAAVIRLVLSRGMRQLMIGVVIGLIGAFAVTGLLGRVDILFRVSDHDPLVFAGIVIVLAGIGMFACWLPARRAARVDPMVALRSE